MIYNDKGMMVTGAQNSNFRQETTKNSQGFAPLAIIR